MHFYVAKQLWYVSPMLQFANVQPRNLSVFKRFTLSFDLHFLRLAWDPLKQGLAKEMKSSLYTLSSRLQLFYTTFLFIR